MAEFNKEYGSKGATGAGLGLGIAGTALGVLNGGLGNVLGGLGGWNNGWNNGRQGVVPICGDDMPVSRYELGQQNEIDRLRGENELLRSNTYNDQKLLEVYKYFDGKLEHINQRLGGQDAWNAAQSTAMGCMRGQIDQLYSLTRLVIPNYKVCPGWGDVTVTPTTPAAAAASAAAPTT